MWRVTGIAIVTFALMSVSMRSQGLGVPEGLDLSGSWVARNFTDALGNPPAMEPTPVDFLGIPLSEAGRAAALSTSPSQISMPERMCDFYPPTYIVLGPAGLKIWPETELRTGATTAWIVSGWTAYAPFPIFMDGRPHPSKYAEHKWQGFSTGEWQDGMLKVTTTHIKYSFVHRNGIPLSPYAVMTEYYSRHGDLLTLAIIVEDPIYLDEPMVRTATFKWNPTQTIPRALPFEVAEELPSLQRGQVPAYPLGAQHPEYAQRRGLPFEASLGGAATMYPEYVKRLKALMNAAPSTTASATKQERAK